MEFGKLANVDRIRFELPGDDPNNSLSAAGRKPRVYLGAPVWSCKEWIGKIYPPKTPARDFLKYYSRQLNSIELNSTFYGIPELETVKEWKQAVPEDFRFAPKVIQWVSHQADPQSAVRIAREFFDRIRHFEEKLGMSFLQLPPTYGPERLGGLEMLLKSLPPRFSLAVEFRHPQWFENHRMKKSAFDLLRAYGVAPVITDVAGRRDVLHASLPVSKAMIRFVGNELHPSDYTRMDDWLKKLKIWFEQGVEELYFFLHHPTYVNVPELALHMIRGFNQESSLGLREIEWVQSTNRQMSLF